MSSGTVYELAYAVAKRNRCAQRQQAESEDQMRQHKEEWERLCARVAALDAELVACGRPPLNPISVLPSTSGCQLWQGQKGLSRKHDHGKTVNSEGGKHSKVEYIHSALHITKKYAVILLHYRWLFVEGDIFISEWGIFGVEIFLHYSRFFIKGDFVIGRVECRGERKQET